MKISYKAAKLISEYVSCNKKLNDLKQTQISGEEYIKFWQKKKAEVVEILTEQFDIVIEIKS
jgi:hypothetical protein